MGAGCNIRFDENDDLVIDDIPDDLMSQIERRAFERGITVEDEMRLIMTGLFHGEGPSGSEERGLATLL